ncbi:MULTISPECIES: Asp-tRNA(Asn)/Glu-tRNA(Gln) amidotransferase subunit GatA [unclassified Neisseria]|uniref:Asp-tRNA(Asn)/Glu-tRNA(Gln) amidotransferase subunit GatA n=1 Tax=unclassified Neisseria TaxID=2623750 RepID=UPI00266676E8|nr:MULTISPECIES: Asp-tRNA(Asn)/Glu-tRNA(Gln) amidotransferase subunit GatA [unclassified Neisseria]MDO1509320.1 Asp-tRNA(Asn)/Glu-tRNA(Gln) amidotransferase subunit GatA [Neisseria sp. MVDL19-042950]MDO1515401.1 Asp-tRNA(Asn)/Glu-tRNA(Gln) amidotransferase subunit GatA [Neisseria sp. MVDL18-041461]MDO1562761.1 Asp-tRNA(Asn)/Glu-tRNA(Gln) amidotransferase subunit GatA [Neisseria sp. MVDL20-010259]
MTQYTLKQASELLQNKQISSTELAQEYLNAIDARNPAINGYITLDKDLTLAEAKAADERIASGNAGILTGVPIAYKDIFCQKGWKSACSSKMLDNFISPYTATVVQNLLNEGMVTLGRTNMDEFAMGSTNETSFYGATKNPWNLENVPGGSSGGSAAVVAARLAPAALGSDTGGSIRQPASHCGITGLKPTYGVVSRFGMVAYASSFDQAGPMAQTAEDCAILLNAMASFDERDSTSLERAKEDYTRDLNQPLKGLKVGLPKEYFGEGMRADVQKTVQTAIDLLKAQGAEMIEVSLPQTELSIPAYYVLASAEASTNLSRYDGVRYGHRAEQFGNLEELYSNTRAEGFGSEVKRRIMIGTYVLSHGYYDAYYLKAQKLRRLVANNFQTALQQCDIILAPTAPTAAPKLGSDINDPVQMYLSDIYTIAVNLAGLPAMTLPAGFSSDGLPIGVQLIGNYFAEAKLLGVAHQMQLESEWHIKTPAGV